jgi:hypothetical protein
MTETTKAAGPTLAETRAIDLVTRWFENRPIRLATLSGDDRAEQEGGGL